jgi:hypothetical protein
MPQRTARMVLGISLLLAVVALGGCPQSTTIADINRDPGRFAGKEVTITGEVTDSFGALGQGAFQVDDGTGRLWVLSENYGVPAKGARVSVTGRATSGVTFAGRSFGNVLRETQPRRERGR